MTLGRNDLCACGSGKKYKRCCLDADRARLAVAAPVREAAAFPGVRPRPLDLELRARVVENTLVAVGCGRAWALDEEEARGRAFSHACATSWRAVASDEPGLEAARERLREADDETRFPRDFEEGFADRWKALAAPVATLMEAGESGAAHLAISLHDAGWPSVLAVEALVRMPSGPRRDLALVEALFSGAEWSADTAARHVGTMSAGARWEAFESVAAAAEAAGCELGGPWWAALFDDDPGDSDVPLAPGPDFGRAVRVLFERGHLQALAAGLFSRLDPSLDSIDSVRRFLDDPALQDTLARMRAESGPLASPV